MNTGDNQARPVGPFVDVVRRNCRAVKWLPTVITRRRLSRRSLAGSTRQTVRNGESYELRDAFSVDFQFKTYVKLRILGSTFCFFCHHFSTWLKSSRALW